MSARLSRGDAILAVAKEMARLANHEKGVFAVHCYHDFGDTHRGSYMVGLSVYHDVNRTSSSGYIAQVPKAYVYDPDWKRKWFRRLLLEKEPPAWLLSYLEIEGAEALL